MYLALRENLYNILILLYWNQTQGGKMDCNRLFCTKCNTSITGGHAIVNEIPLWFFGYVILFSPRLNYIVLLILFWVFNAWDDQVVIPSSIIIWLSIKRSHQYTDIIRDL